MRTIYGVGPVRELLRVKPKGIKQLLVESGRAAREGADPVAQIVAAARAAGITVDERRRPELDRIAGADARHQGVIAMTADAQYAALDDIVAAAQGPALVVVLDGVQDPHNLGAVVRSAYVLGAQGVIVPEHRAAHVTPAVTKASAGATELLPIAIVKNVARALGELKDAGLWTVAIDATEDAKPLAQVDLTGPVALVLGAEGGGVRSLTTKSCDLHAMIPMVGEGVGSLNVSVAAGIALYEVVRQRSR